MNINDAPVRYAGVNIELVSVCFNFLIFFMTILLEFSILTGGRISNVQLHIGAKDHHECQNYIVRTLIS